ncbi:MAG: hypothetical protein JWQ07_5746 [Ramlibacter sp.]|nr:hypothetical protein [Ramlibacter sp.]
MPRHVPDPDVAVRWPEPPARSNPLVRVTLMLPESATRPVADIRLLLDAHGDRLLEAVSHGLALYSDAIKIAYRHIKRCD